MTPKHFLILLLALFATSFAQSDDELHIPVENDNQFPPDNHPELDPAPVEGSGAGVIEEPLETATEAKVPPAPLLEDVQITSTLIDNETLTTAADHSCPSPCVCNVEGDSTKYIVDCSGYELTELPKPLDSKTTELNLRNNKLTGVPKQLAALKNLEILNLDHNEIMDIAAGSISELPELISLKLGNNRLIEYPTDLKNSFGLTKLQELDLGGNDMRTALKPETFSNFKALRQLTLPSATPPPNLVEDICAALTESLETVCTGSCSTKEFDCPDAPQTFESDLLDVALPGLIALGTSPDEIADPSVSSTSNTIITEQAENEEKGRTSPSTNITITDGTQSETTATAKASVSNVSFRSAVIKATNEEAEPTETDREKSKPTETDAKSTVADTSTKVPAKVEGEVIGATTSNTKTGGVDKSVIGIIVAGMVLVVAGITIKKNWSSIKNRFSSSPRNASERTANANGTTPEEVPLQEKSPV